MRSMVEGQTPRCPEYPPPHCMRSPSPSKLREDFPRVYARGRSRVRYTATFVTLGTPRSGTRIGEALV